MDLPDSIKQEETEEPEKKEEPQEKSEPLELIKMSGRFYNMGGADGRTADLKAGNFIANFFRGFNWFEMVLFFGAFIIPLTFGLVFRSTPFEIIAS